MNRTPGFTAELAKIGDTPELFESPYRVLIDRLSHEVPFYRFHLKAAMLAGTYVINDPFWWSADEKFFGFSLAARLGVKVPRTVMLPQRELHGAHQSRALPAQPQVPARLGGHRRLRRLPGDPQARGRRRLAARHPVNDLQELMAAYDASGELVMTLQEFIDFDEYVRCLCIGKEFFLPIQYDPRRKDRRGLNGLYVDREAHWLPKPLETKVLDACWSINQSLGYDMNSVELAVKDGVPYAIDFTNPAPDMCSRSLGPRYFKIVVEQMAKFAIQKAREGKPNAGGLRLAALPRRARPAPRGALRGAASRSRLAV